MASQIPHATTARPAAEATRPQPARPQPRTIEARHAPAPPPSTQVKLSTAGQSAAANVATNAAKESARQSAQQHTQATQASNREAQARQALAKAYST